jgi:hypothetical protein
MNVTAGRRPVWRWIAPIGIVALLVAAPATSAASPTTIRPSQAATTPKLELIEQRLGVDPNGTIQLRYLLTGLSGDPLQLRAPADSTDPATTETTEAPGADTPEPAPALPALTLEVTNYAPLANAADVARVVGSDVNPNTFRGITEAIDGIAIDARPLLTPNDDGTANIDIDIDTDVVESIETRLKLERPGIYPLRVQLLLDDVLIATAGTVVQRVAGAVDTGVDAPPPIDFAVVTATPGPPPDPDQAALDIARAELDGAVELAAAITAPVTLEVPPTLIAEHAATPEGAERLAASLADDELVALPIVPLDVSAAVAAGQAEAYTRLLGAGEDLLTESLPTTSSRRDIWLTTDPLSAGGAQLLRDLGTRFVVIPADLYAATIDGDLPPSDQFVEAELPDGGTLPFLLVSPLADELTPEAADRTLDESTATEWAVTTLATLLVDQSTADEAAISTLGRPARRSHVLTAPDLSSPDARLIQALEVLAMTTPTVRFAPGSALIGLTDVHVDDDGQPVTIELPDVAGPSLDARVALLDNTGLELVSAASMLPEGDPRTAEWSAQLDVMISTGYTDAEAQALADELIAEAHSFTEAVELPEPFTFTLTGSTGIIEIRIGNTLDEPLDVIVALDSRKVTFPEGDQRVTLRPLDETSVNVPVEAEANGTSSITLVVSTPAGQTLGEPVTLTARVTALTGLGQVLTGGFILVLLTWWFTHWRGRRQAALVTDGRDRHPSSRTVESAEL